MELIQTKDYLLWIDEEAEIKEEDYYHWKLTNTVQINRLFEEDRRLGRKGPGGHVSKVIAYRKLNESAKELDLSELPKPFEVNYRKLAIDIFEKYTGKKFDKNLLGDCNSVLAIETGYKAAQSHSKQFSLEDVIEVLKLVLNNWKTSCINTKGEINIEFLADIEINLKSLSTQQLPKEFIPEYEKEIVGEVAGTTYINEKLKTTTNSEGKEVLVGTYKY